MYFNPEELLSLDALAPGSAIHIIGVCGVAMAPLAIALASRGFRVSGSDGECFEPMGSLLRASSVSVQVGYDPSHIPDDVLLVIPGNTAKEDNVEVQEVIARGLPYSIFPKLLYDLLIKDRHSIVVTGTHGKSTTTALLATLFNELGARPNWFVGGQPIGLDAWHADTGGMSIVEGDEYISSFFSPVAKFTYYQPDTLVVNAVELDHVDVYPNLAAMQAAFTKLVKSVPLNGNVVVAIDDPGLRRLALDWKEAGAPIITFGSSVEADVQLVTRRALDTGRQLVEVRSDRFGDGSWEVSLIGRHNSMNSIAAWICGRLHGFTCEEIASALGKYQGLRRRQEVRYRGAETILIEDFAHHPTSIKETLEGLQEHYPHHRIWALFEPRTISNRRGIFRERYQEAFAAAHHVRMLELLASDQSTPVLDTRSLCDELRSGGIDATSHPDPNDIASNVLKGATGEDLVVVMSSGPFGRIVSLLESKLRERDTLQLEILQ